MGGADRLGVWLGDIRVAELLPRKDGSIALRYSEEALGTWPLNSPLISCSLPLGPRAQPALAFCRGLLPEGNALRALAERAGVAANDTYGLLERYGRDVAGALVVAAEEPEERRFGVEEYSERSLREAIENLDEHPLGAHDDSELSLAGIQDKLLLVDLDGMGWGRPLHGRPSTHILKVDDRLRPGLIDAEAECLRLARALGLSEIDIRVETLGESRCLIVSRFDRAIEPDGAVRRIHQEDLCQATGVDPSDRRGRAKYERAGGPTLRQAAALLDSYAGDVEAQLDRLVEITTFTVMSGNADAHGKNLALLHPEPGRIELAPLYDTVPTVLWPKLRAEAAMSIGAQVSLPDVTLKDIVREGRAWGHREDRVEAVAIATIEAATAALEHGEIDPASDLAKLVAKRAKQLLRS
jgi:serine/threonine-protein kinase HipA